MWNEFFRILHTAIDEIGQHIAQNASITRTAFRQFVTGLLIRLDGVMASRFGQACHARKLDGKGYPLPEFFKMLVELDYNGKRASAPFLTARLA